MIGRLLFFSILSSTCIARRWALFASDTIEDIYFLDTCSGLAVDVTNPWRSSELMYNPQNHILQIMTQVA